MTWKEFVVKTMGADQQQDAAKKANINASTISRWLKSGKPGEATNVAAFARAYKRPVLDAFVAAGFITATEAKVRPTAMPNFSQLTNDELLELVRARMTEGSEEHVRSATTKAPASGPGKAGLSAVPTTTDDAVAALEKEGSIVGEQGVEEHP